MYYLVRNVFSIYQNHNISDLRANTKKEVYDAVKLYTLKFYQKLGYDFIKQKGIVSEIKKEIVKKGFEGITDPHIINDMKRFKKQEENLSYSPIELAIMFSRENEGKFKEFIDKYVDYLLRNIDVTDESKRNFLISNNRVEKILSKPKFAEELYIMMMKRRAIRLKTL